MYLLFVLVLTCVGLSTQQYDYCDPDLCPYGVTHVACNGLTEPDYYACGAGAREIALTESIQNLIVNLHNNHRSVVASGNQYNAQYEYFQQAWRMPTIFWDEELAEIAAALARGCEFEHDECRNTWRFPSAGQNLAYFPGLSETQNIEELVTTFVDLWFAENQYATPSLMENFSMEWLYMIGHFTQVVSDRTTRVGCSLVSYLRDGSTTYLFACNYSFAANGDNGTIYVAGPACGGCSAGCSTYYPGLCHENEII